MAKIFSGKNKFYFNRFVFAFLFIPLFYFPCYISNDLVSKLTKEDGIYEYAGALFFLLTSIAFFTLAIRPKYYIAFKNTKKFPERKYFIVLALLFFFAFGEEISWGQRIFGFETPEAIKDINIQQEFNLHNLKWFHGKTEERVEKTGIMALFTANRLFYLALLTYLLFIPLIYSLNTKFKHLIDKIHVPVPNIIVGVFFAFNLIYGNTLRALFTEIKGHGIVEIKETVIALILIMLPLFFMNFKSFRNRRI